MIYLDIMGFMGYSNSQPSIPEQKHKATVLEKYKSICLGIPNIVLVVIYIYTLWLFNVANWKILMFHR